MLNLHKVRRGQVFSFTLTELILLILFILLLLLWFITDKKNEDLIKKNEELNKWIEVTGTSTPEEYKCCIQIFLTRQRLLIFKTD